MCGILFIASVGNCDDPGATADIQQYTPGLQARGPDHLGAQQATVNCPQLQQCQGSDGSHDTLLHLHLHLAASLLQLRGSQPSTSPLVDEQGNVLCFNGEVFGGLDVAPGSNDGKAVLAALARAGASQAAGAIGSSCSGGASRGGSAVRQQHRDHGHLQLPQQDEQQRQHQQGKQQQQLDGLQDEAALSTIPALLSQLRGPWSLVYWHQQHQRLWFGRDLLGKRSLLLQDPRSSCCGSSCGTTSPHQRLVLSSVAPFTLHQQQEASCQQQQQAWIELPPGLYSIAAQDLWGLLTCQHTTAAAAQANSSNSCSLSYATVGQAAGVDPSAGGTGATGGTLGAGGTVCTSGSLAAPAHVRCIVDAAGGADEAGANRGVFTAKELCALLPGVDHHPWEDAQLLQLQQYVRQVQTLAVPQLQPQPQPQPGLQQQPQLQLRLQPQPQPQQEGAQVAAEGGCELDQAVQQLLHVLRAAVEVRCLTINSPQQQQQQRPSDALHSASNEAAAEADIAAAAAAGGVAGPASRLNLPPAPLLILFSGGVDSTLIAALAHQVLPTGVPIDLSNVCFDGGRSADRAAARSAVLELAATAPDRPWRLIEVDSSLQEVDVLSQHIKGLLNPAATVMDWNIGSALWLAARAIGRVWVPVRRQQQQRGQQQAGDTTAAAASVAANAQELEQCGWQLEPLGDGIPPAARAADATSATPPVEQQQQQQQQAAEACKQQQQQQHGQQGQLDLPYRSAARVVLLGHGADEQCGGYSRHRTKYREAGHQGIADELTLDTTRLWLRNLGRDDRLVADHGREGRHPFLDEGVMSCLLGMPLHVLVDYSQPPGAGDKRILRHLLADLGLPLAAGREKRAIQFGSRIGQLSNKRDFGSNRRANKQQAGSLKMAVAAAD